MVRIRIAKHVEDVRTLLENFVKTDLTPEERQDMAQLQDAADHASMRIKTISNDDPEVLGLILELVGTILDRQGQIMKAMIMRTSANDIKH